MSVVSVNIGDGGHVRLLNDPTKTPEYRQFAERRDSFLKEHPAIKRPSSNERALEIELLAQVGGKPSNDCSVSPKLAADYAAYQAKQNHKSVRESQLEQELMNQVSGGNNHAYNQ